MDKFFKKNINSGQKKGSLKRLYYDTMNVNFKTHKPRYFITYACVHMWENVHKGLRKLRPTSSPISLKISL